MKLRKLYSVRVGVPYYSHKSSLSEQEKEKERAVIAIIPN